MNEYNFNNSATDLGTDNFTFTTTKEVLLEQMKIKLRGAETTSAVILNVLKGATNVYSNNEVIGMVDDYVTFDMDKTILDSSSTYTFNLILTDAQVYVDNENDAENPEDVALTISSEKMWNCKITMQNNGWEIISGEYPTIVGNYSNGEEFDWQRGSEGNPLNELVWIIGNTDFPTVRGMNDDGKEFDWARNRVGEPLNQSVWKIDSETNEGYPYNWLSIDYEEFTPSDKVTFLQYVPIVI